MDVEKHDDDGTIMMMTNNMAIDTMMSVMAVSMMTMRISLMVINMIVMTKGPCGGFGRRSEDRPQTRRRPYTACCRDYKRRLS